MAGNSQGPICHHLIISGKVAWTRNNTSLFRASQNEPWCTTVAPSIRSKWRPSEIESEGVDLKCSRKPSLLAGWHSPNLMLNREPGGGERGCRITCYPPMVRHPAQFEPLASIGKRFTGVHIFLISLFDNIEITLFCCSLHHLALLTPEACMAMYRSIASKSLHVCFFHMLLYSIKNIWIS